MFACKRFASDCFLEEFSIYMQIFEEKFKCVEWKWNAEAIFWILSSDEGLKTSGLKGIHNRLINLSGICKIWNPRITNLLLNQSLKARQLKSSNSISINFPFQFSQLPLSNYLQYRSERRYNWYMQNNFELN